MRPILAIVLLTAACSACGVGSNSKATPTAASEAKNDKARRAAPLTEDEKHRLYAAVLVATDAQLQTELYQKVCQQIGIMNSDGIPKENYTSFVSEERLQWMRKPEAAEFKREINTREKAQEYLKERLPQ
jgi:hypothetical protein